MSNTETYAGKISRKLRKKLRIIDVAAGRKPADVVLKNATYLDVFCNELCQGDIAVAEGLIVGMGDYHGEREYDVSGKIVLPGFVDAHIHLESALVLPSEFAKAVLPHGTTTVITEMTIERTGNEIQITAQKFKPTAGADSISYETITYHGTDVRKILANTSLAHCTQIKFAGQPDLRILHDLYHYRDLRGNTKVNNTQTVNELLKDYDHSQH